MDKHQWKIIGWLGVPIAILPMVIISFLAFKMPGNSLITNYGNKIDYLFFIIGIVIAIIGTLKSRD